MCGFEVEGENEKRGGVTRTLQFCNGLQPVFGSGTKDAGMEGSGRGHSVRPVHLVLSAFQTVMKGLVVWLKFNQLIPMEDGGAPLSRFLAGLSLSQVPVDNFIAGDTKIIRTVFAQYLIVFQKTF